MKKIVMVIATGLGTGYFPISGTVASALAILLYLPLARFNNARSTGNILIYLSICCFVTGLSIWTSTLAEKWLGEKDPHKIVIDEIAGYFFAVFLLPTKAVWLIGAFVVFRIFDIAKPPPIYQSQKLPGGLGITIDDVLAGIATCIFMHLLRVLFM